MIFDTAAAAWVVRDAFPNILVQFPKRGVQGGGGGRKPGQTVTDLFPWRTCLVSGSTKAAAYLHTCHLGFAAQSRPWVRRGWGAPRHTWSQWTSHGSKSCSVELLWLWTKEQEVRKSIWVCLSPSALHTHLYLWLKTTTKRKVMDSSRMFSRRIWHTFPSAMTFRLLWHNIR